MSEGAVLELGRSAVVTGLTVCAPMLVAGLLVGVLTAPWVLRTLVGFTAWVFRQMAAAGN